MALTVTDYYASETEIAALLHIGTATNSVDFSDADLNYCLPIMQGEIHEFLIAEGLIAAGPVLSTAQGYYTIKSVLTFMLQEWNHRRQINKNTLGIEGLAQGTMGVYLNTELKVQLLGAFQVTDDLAIDTITIGRHQYHEVYN